MSGKLTDERFMKMSQRYDEEQQQLKKDIEELQRQCDRENEVYGDENADADYPP